MFSTGTASVICPIDRIVYQQKSLKIPLNIDTGESLAGRLFRELTAIQVRRWSYDYKLLALIWIFLNKHNIADE